MEHLAVADPVIQEIHMVSSRRTSKALFYNNLHILLEQYAAQNNLNDNNNQQELLHPQVVLTAYDEVLYSFNVFQQEVQHSVKFPLTSLQIWPYYGRTIAQLVNELGVSRQTLMRRCTDMDGYASWQGPSTDETHCLAIQWHPEGRRMFACRRSTSWRRTKRRIRRFMRQELFIERQPVHQHLTYFYEVNGTKYGPIENDHDWEFVVNMNVHVQRINLLMVVAGVAEE